MQFMGWLLSGYDYRICKYGHRFDDNHGLNFDDHTRDKTCLNYHFVEDTYDDLEAFTCSRDGRSGLRKVLSKVAHQLGHL